ncbi:MAG TPA: PilZ domain-containing protein [Xanthobacteraceae bacterium]|nr:PilZ domain-containing protein [Xanthobacteraceae bacterium]
MAIAQTRRAVRVLPLNQERRKHQRVKVALTGRYMLQNRQEYSCQTLNMSPGGVALIAEKLPQVGELVVAYIDHLGRLEGRCVRHISNGFAMTVAGTIRRRDKLASQLTWFANRNALGLPEDRRHERFALRDPRSTLTLPTGVTIPCRVMDVSLSGAAVATEIAVPIGTPVTLGRTKGRVVRQLEGGFAMEFGRLQNPDTLEHDLGNDG